MLAAEDKIKVVGPDDPCYSAPSLGIEFQEIFISSGQSTDTNTIAPQPGPFTENKTYHVGKVSASGDYKICYCSSVVSCSNPYDFGGIAGYLLVQGADATQVYVCRRMGDCTIELKGWRLTPSDRLKIVSEGGSCADPPSFGFGVNPSWPEPAFRNDQPPVTEFLDNTNTSSINRFFVGKASLSTSEEGCAPDDVNCGYTLCYCPGFGGCDDDSEFTHKAGALRVTESLRGISIKEDFPVISWSLGLEVECAYDGGYIVCVAKDGPATSWGQYADSSFFADGPGIDDVGWGESSQQAVSGKNTVEIKLTRFVSAGDSLRAWCFLSDTPTYVFPPTLDGAPITVPSGMKKPKVEFLQRRGWNGARFLITIADLVVGYQSETEVENALNEIRIMNELSTQGCDSVLYDMEEKLIPTESTTDDFGNLFLVATDLTQIDTTLCMDDPGCKLEICFLSGPGVFAIPMIEQMTLLKTPTLEDQPIVRGASNSFQVNRATNTYKGSVSFMSLLELDGRDTECPTKKEAVEMGRFVEIGTNGESVDFVFNGNIGEYILCLLDDNADNADNTPLNKIGNFMAVEAITDIQQSAKQSTRTTLRLDVSATLKGEVTCVVKTAASVDEKQPEISSSVAFIPGLNAAEQAKLIIASRKKLYDYLTSDEGTLAKSSTKVEEPIPPNVTVVLVLNTFPSSDEVPAWCWHSAVSSQMVTMPEDSKGKFFLLPGENPVGIPLPTFLWPDVDFLIRIQNVPDTSQSRIKLVNRTEECSPVEVMYDSSTPVVQYPEGQEQTIQKYLKASWSTRLICFFELPTSMPLIVATPSGPTIEFTQGTQPTAALNVDGVFNEYVHRGLPVNLLFTNVNDGEYGQIYILSEEDFKANDDHCLPENGISGEDSSAEAETAEAYIERVAAIKMKQVVLLPSASGEFTHLVFLDGDDTENLMLGQGYVVCYVGDGTDRTRIFNQVGIKVPGKDDIETELKVRDVITNIAKDEAYELAGGEETNSRQVRTLVECSLTGTLRCMITVKEMERTPLKSEIRGDYKDTEPEEFVPVMKDEDVLFRTEDVAVTESNSNTTVIPGGMELNQQYVPNIVGRPRGVEPWVHIWCFHDRSALIFPNNEEGQRITLAVRAPPEITYEQPVGTPRRVITLSQGVMFPPLLPIWEDPDFPQHPWDYVEFAVSPPLPAGIEMSDNRDDGTLGQIRAQTADAATQPDNEADPPPTYEITVQSVNDNLKSRTAQLTLSVHGVGGCDTQSVKSTEVVMTCRIRDTNNFHAQVLYIMTDPPAGYDEDSFFCYEPSKPETPGNRKLECKKQGEACCCFLHMGNISPNVTQSTLYTARLKSDQCGYAQSQSYQFATMIAGINPMQEDDAVKKLSEGMDDFLLPSGPEPVHIEFEMKIDMDYSRCDPDVVGAEQAAQCKTNMESDLARLLDAPPGMIEVTGVREG
jgi:hypothetical protein